MTRIEIIEKMEVIMKENFQEVKYKEFDDNLTECGLDSITTIKLIVIIEETFGFEFADEDLLMKNFLTLNAIVDYIYRKKSI